MSQDPTSPGSSDAAPDGASQESYVVVARRYRPLTFSDLVGQQQISQALINAINTNRVGHAYLFTGARGVGKTSTARIFAKALNAPNGPTAEPDCDSDICLAIDAGSDVDVLEIDGASNRGIDEIRQLRSNANVRPSRARYKIYIIDEVHMLTTAAFNALLKTLEEPPAHVKFIFCTTDPQKIPITVLSRCQRYDFAPVDAVSIVERLEHIVTTEGRQAEPEALQLLARRAEGSMRDSQSLLEQVLAYCSSTVTVDDVHQMLGTAASGRLASVTDPLVQRDAAGALAALDQAVTEGVDCGQLAEQLLGFARDMMAANVGCPVDLMRHINAADFASLQEAGKQFGLETNLAAYEILDQAVTRMRMSTQPRTLLEIALVRICNLENLDQLSSLIAQLQSGVVLPAPAPRTRPSTGPAAAAPAAPQTAAPQTAAPKTAAPKTAAPQSTGPSPPASQSPAAPAAATTPTAEKKTPQVVIEPEKQPSSPVATQQLTEQSVDRIWKQVLEQLGDMTSDFASYYDHVAISAPDSLVVHFRERYTLQKESCEQPDRKASLEQTMASLVGRRIRIDLAIIAEPKQQRSAAPKASIFQLMREKESHPFVRQAVDLFDAEVTKVDVPRNPRSGSKDSPSTDAS